jgi:hypothetical protein
MKNKNFMQRALLAGAFTAMAVGSANAQSTDITGVIGQLGGYSTAGIAIGIGVLLFVLGRSIVRKVAR